MSSYRILLVPDLHDNTKSGFPLQDEAIDTILSGIADKAPFDLIVHTGDLGNKGNEELLVKGLELLKRIQNKLSKPPLILSPGNHDVQWPGSIKEFTDWDKNKRYGQYVDKVKTVFELENKERMVHRSLLLDNEVRTEEVESAMEALINNGFDTKKITLAQRECLPFYWDRKKNIFTLSLSTADYSGSLYIPEGEDIKSFIENIHKAEANGIPTEILDRACKRDIPYVTKKQIDAVETAIGILKSRRKTKSKFAKAIKIVCLHHPLYDLAPETEFREFDIVVNGSSIMHKLCGWGFSVILYGHKHKNRISIHHGSWTNEVNICEVAAIAGGNILGYGNQNEPTFQIIEIKKTKEVKYHERSIEVTELSTPSFAIVKETKLLSIDSNGDIRWLRGEDENNCLLKRNHKLTKNFYSSVKKIERQFRQKKLHKYTNDYDHADDFIHSFLDFLKGYSEGEHGLTDEYIKTMSDNIKTAKAYYFVDILGSSAWAHPNFMWHLAIQLKGYLERNYVTFNNGRWKYNTLIEKAVKIASKNSGKSLPAKDDKPLEPLDFNICRILIWKEEMLAKMTGRIIIRLHEIFKIPLFYLEKKAAPKLITSDFNIITGKNNRSKVLVYNRNKRKRSFCDDKDVSSYKKLFEDALKNKEIIFAKDKLDEMLN